MTQRWGDTGEVRLARSEHDSASQGTPRRKWDDLPPGKSKDKDKDDPEPDPDPEPEPEPDPEDEFTPPLAAFDIEVDGGTVNGTYTVQPDEPIYSQQTVIAVRDADDENLDFGHRGEETLSREETFTASRTLPAGEYEAWVAYQAEDGWVDLEPVVPFAVEGDDEDPGDDDDEDDEPDPEPEPDPDPEPEPPGDGGGDPANPPAPGNWRLEFADEFEGSTWDRDTWTDRSSSQGDGMQGNAGNNEQLEWNQGDNCTVEDGSLVLTAKRERHVSSSGYQYDWTSCLLTSTPSYSMEYGYIEERAIFPAERGFWPAFWTWQVPGGSQTMETDVYEYYSDNRSRLYLTSHVGDRGGCVADLWFDPTEDYHVYGADIRPDGTTWYVDGEVVCEAPGAPSGPQDLITNLAVYSGIPPADGTNSAEKRVDYIRAWERD